MAERIPHADTETRQAFQRMEARVSGGSDPGHSHTGASLSGIDISDDTNLAVTAPIVLTGDTLSLNQAGVDHGSIGGLMDDDHAQYHTDARGDARYYTEVELDAGQLDNRYFRENEHLASSAGAADAGKPIVLDAAGHIDATMINDGDVDHANLANVTTDQHHAQVHTAQSHSDITSTGAQIETAVAASHAQSHNAASHSDIASTGAAIDAAVTASHAEAHSVVSHNDTTGTGAELNTLTDNSMADALHRHSELSASDGTPDATVAVDAAGAVTMGGTLGVTGAITGPNVSSGADPGHTHTIASLPGAGFVDRGDPAAFDYFIGGGITADGAAHDLDLVGDGKIPSGCYAVYIRFSVISGVTGNGAYFYKKGNSNLYNIIQIMPVNTVRHEAEGVCPVDSNGKITYVCNANVTTCNMCVKGWFI